MAGLGAAALFADLRARALPLRQPNVSFGPLTLQFEFPAACGPLYRRRWLQAPGVASLHFGYQREPAPRQDALVFRRFDASGYEARAPGASVVLDRASGHGTVTVHAPDAEAEAVHNAAIEAMLAAGLAEVLGRAGIALHAATLQVGGRAWVIAGHSGAGKSTLARRFPGVASHDEVAYLVPTPAGWTVWHHAEWRGLPGDHAAVLPLGGLFVLLPDDRSRTTVIEAPAGEHAALILARAYHAGGAATQHVLQAAAALANDVPVGLLSHSLDDAPEVVVQTLAAYADRQERA